MSLVKHATPVEVWAALDSPDDWSLNFFQWLITRTMNHGLDFRHGILHAAALCSSDAGEFLSGAKAHFFYDKPLTAIVDAVTGQTLKENMLEEMSDQLWGIAEGAARLGYTLEDVARYNQRKLIKRYPTQYSNQAAQARADKAPILAGREPIGG